MAANLQALQNQQAANQKALEDLQAAHQKTIDDLKAANLKALDDLKNADQLKIDALIAQHQATIADLTKQQADVIAQLKADHQTELSARYVAGAKDILAVATNFINSSYFTDDKLKAMTTNPQAYWGQIINAHDSQPNLVNPDRYDLTQLKTAFPDVAKYLPPTKWSSGNVNKNYLLGEAQATLNIINALKDFKLQNGVTTDPILDAMITRLTERAKNYIKDSNNLSSPIAIDLNNDNKISTKHASQGAIFDLKANGVKSQISWVSSEDGFLALDRNKNGLIDNGGELFGDQHGAANGYDELKKFDSNNDGVMDKNDTVFNDLKVWQDSNGDGKTQAGELKSLTELGITSLSLNYTTGGQHIDSNDVYHKESSTVAFADGTTRKSEDIWLELRS
jgi:hypothetical protein